MKVIWYVEMGPKCGDDVVVHVGEVEIVVGRVKVFGDSWDVWSWSGAVGDRRGLDRGVPLGNGDAEGTRIGRADVVVDPV